MTTESMTAGTLIERIRDDQRGRIHDYREGSPLAEIAWANGSRSVEGVAALRIIEERVCPACSGDCYDGDGRRCRRCAATGRVEVKSA